MKKTMYNYQYSNKYSLQKINIYAYSFFATIILNKMDEEVEYFNIDLNSIISNISDSLIDNDKLEKLRHNNHDNYYQLDTKFLKEVDSRYQKYADNVLNDYMTINSHELLNDNEASALKHQTIINKISKKIELLKERVKEDLMTIMSYVDNDEKQLDLTFMDDDNEIAKKLKNRYNAMLLYKSVINFDNIHNEMERQKTRLALIRQLIPLTKRYKEKRKLYVMDTYDDINTKTLKGNLSVIISEYIFLLSIQEFNDLKKVYQGLLEDDYTYVSEFMYVYRMIMDKVWKHCLSDCHQYNFDFNYLISNQENITSDIKISFINRYNMHNYSDTGYVCEYEGNMFDAFNVSNDSLLEMPLPYSITKPYEFVIKDISKIKVVAKYNKGIKPVIDYKYRVIEIR